MNALRELADPDNRRYHYPYINCTNCGPRYTVILALPYDRPNTTMKDGRLMNTATGNITIRPTVDFMRSRLHARSAVLITTCDMRRKKLCAATSSDSASGEF